MKHARTLLALLAFVLGCEDPPTKPVSAPPPPPEAPPPTTAEQIAHSVQAGRIWLARTQNENGSWNCDSCDLPDSAGLTGLAMLALDGGDDERFQDAVRAAADWLSKAQRKDGAFLVERFEEHAIVLWALARASRAGDAETYRTTAERVAAYIARVQPPHGGFDRKGPTEDGDADPAVGVWLVLALLAARDAGIPLPHETLRRSTECLCRMHRDAPYCPPARLFGQAVDGRYIREAAEETMPGALSVGSSYGRPVGDMTYTLLVAGAAHAVGDSLLAEYRRACLGPLCRAQETTRRDKDGNYIEGSWSPKQHRGGKPRSRTALTALAVLCLTPHEWAPAPRPKAEKPAW